MRQTSAATQCFEQVIVWQKAHAWVLTVYRLTAAFPRHELYGLVSQLRRAAVSVPANFAEGYGKRSRVDKARFPNIAQGSLAEARYYLILANDLNYGDTTQSLTHVDEIGRILRAYHDRLLTPHSPDS